MRQAGRYLPEYRELRAEAGGFLKMCYTPELACEITLQPIRRFNMDAAIIFSDILVVPHALGRELTFTTGQGPWLDPITTLAQAEALDVSQMMPHLAPVYEALHLTRAALPADTALIGFAGAPWTLACYLLDGNGKTDFINARSSLYTNPVLLDHLMETLTQAVSEHLIAQIHAGAEAVQLFDSWASHVPSSHKEMLLYRPAKAIVDAVRAVHPTTPIICFPRAIGEADYARYAAYVQPDGLSVDQFTDMVALRELVPDELVLQGNFDPLALVHNMDILTTQVEELRLAMRGRPFVFNLGHGVVPSVPPEHMQQLLDAIRH